jgi:hypothetical protein
LIAARNGRLFRFLRLCRRELSRNGVTEQW